MKKFTKKSLLLLIATALLLTATVSSTVAYLMAGTGEVVNTFQPGEAKTEIHEDFNKETKSNITIENTGEVNVYVRATIVGKWVDAQGNAVKSWTPPEAQVNRTYWHRRDSDAAGYYYYFNYILAPGQTTPPLLLSPIDKYGGLDKIPEGADHLEVTVLQQCIQADGTENGVPIVSTYWKWSTTPFEVYNPSSTN